MNRCLPAIVVGAALSVMLGLPAQAADAGTPYNDPVRRANPNSQQGTVRSTPPLRGPTTQPLARPPTLDNGGIGNGQNLRREQQPPRLEPTRPPRESTRTP